MEQSNDRHILDNINQIENQLKHLEKEEEQNFLKPKG